MRVEVVKVDGATLRLVGELDLSSIGDLTAALEQAMPRRGDLTLDLSHLAFLGSEGVRLFIQLARDREGIGRLVLANPLPPVRRVLDLTGLGHILPNLNIDPATAADLL